MNRVLAFALLATVSFTIPAAAGTSVSDVEKIQLQSAMQVSINQKLVDGGFMYLDENKAEVRKLYPAQAHPMILQMGEHFILCSDFRDETGNKINIDFYVARSADGFVVFDTVVDNRKPIDKMMKAGRVTVLK